MSKRLCAILLSCCMLLGLAACGDAGTGAESSNVALEERINQELIYVASRVDFQLGSTVADVDFKVYGPNIYYPKGQQIVTYSTEDKSETPDTFNWENAPGEWAFERVSYSGSGEVYGLVKVAGEAAPYLCKFDTERNLAVACDLSEYYEQAGENYSAANSRLEVGTDGRVYLSNIHVLWIFEPDGSFKDTVSFGNTKDVLVQDFQSDARRNLYVLYEDSANQSQYVAEIDTEKGAVKALQQTIGLTGISAGEEGLLGFNQATVYTYDREACALTELFTWSECKVEGAVTYAAKLLADGRVFAAGNPSGGGVDSFLVKSTQSTAPTISTGENETGKINIRLGVLVNASNEQLLAMHRFNKTNPRYNVIIQEYGEDRDEAIALLEADVAAGNAPDLLDLGILGLDVAGMVENGYLEDLSLYLSESEVLSEGDFLNFALEEYNYDGVLAAIPHSFQMSTLIGNSEYVGEEPGWTLEEIVSFLEDYGTGETSIFGDDPTRANVIYNLLLFNETLFIDRMAGTCNFDNDLFRRLVDAVADFPAEYDSSKVYSAYTNLQSGKSLLCQIGVTDFSRLQPYAAALSGALTCIGYPTEEGVGIRISSMDPMGISALSEYKDGAWEFIESFLQYAETDQFNYPTHIPSLEKMVAWNLENSKRGHMTGADGFKYEYHQPTQEEVEVYLEMMEVARPKPRNTDWIDIVTEEINAYYAGDKSVDEAIESIEKNVLSELAE